MVEYKENVFNMDSNLRRKQFYQVEIIQIFYFDKENVFNFLIFVEYLVGIVFFDGDSIFLFSIY